MSVDGLYELAADTLAALGERTVAVAESLTGGLIGATLTEVPGASRSFRGAVVAYATDVKVSVLGVDAMLIRSGGAVQVAVALQMARGVCKYLQAQFGLAVTGVAGPDSQDGHLPGTVFVAVVLCSPDGEVLDSAEESLNIDLSAVAPSAQRAYIRNQTVECALNLLRVLASPRMLE
jgi:nicotinamide-nucleotide amidase